MHAYELNQFCNQPLRFPHRYFTKPSCLRFKSNPLIQFTCAYWPMLEDIRVPKGCWFVQGHFLPILGYHMTSMQPCPVNMKIIIVAVITNVKSLAEGPVDSAVMSVQLISKNKKFLTFDLSLEITSITNFQ